MKIVSFGNCNAHGIGLALAQMMPDHEVISYEYVAVKRDNQTEEALSKLKGADLVFSNMNAPEFPMTGEASVSRNVVLYPSVSFTGFHPDCCVLPNISPLGPYHSMIAVAGFTLGLSLDDTLKLYRDDVFERLNYYSEFEAAKSFYLNHVKSFDFDLTVDFDCWIAQGAFMHTVNHPKVFALTDLAFHLAKKSDLTNRYAKRVEALQDWLSGHPIFAVYPEIASRIGVETQPLFKRSGFNSQSVMSLRTFVELSLKLYQGVAQMPTTDRLTGVTETIRQII
jgi:hypothetical protein